VRGIFQPPRLILQPKGFICLNGYKRTKSFCFYKSLKCELIFSLQNPSLIQVNGIQGHISTNRNSWRYEAKRLMEVQYNLRNKRH
jgi:hypothetical protein